MDRYQKNVAITTYTISNIVNINNNYIEFIKNCIISIIIPNMILVIVFHSSDNYKYYKKLLYKIIYFPTFKILHYVDNIKLKKVITYEFSNR